MKTKFFTLLYITLSFHFLAAQDLNYSILTIPDSLTKKTNSVIRLSETVTELKSSKKMVTKINKVVTVLNKIGNHESEIVIHYDKNTSIKSLKAVFYNSLGGEIKKVSKNKFEDYASADGISLHNDGRLKYYKYVPTTYPYTMHIQYEIETSNTAFIRRWLPINSYYQSIEKSTFKISHPNDIKLTSLEKNFDSFNITKSHTGNVFQYEIKNQIAFKPEEYSPEFIAIFPSVKFASNKFHLEGYDGYANNWNDFSKWMHNNLLEPRNNLSESTKTYIKNMVKDIEDPIERARKVYEYVQKKTRYISIQVGIGGWMPMLTNDVDKLGYGDCKALTYYTKALLDAAEVESYYTAVHAGKRKRNIEEDLVSVQGNHVFLYVPSENKDYWLECTSQTTPFGFQGDFTDDRDVLVISKDGGKIVKTPAYNEKNSLQQTKATYTISQEGHIKAKVAIESSGLQYDYHFNIEKKNKRDLDEYYKDSYWDYINNLTINSVEFDNNKKDIVFKEVLEITAENYASISANRMLITLNAFNRHTNSLKRYRDRKFPLYVARGFYDKDEFIINLPSDFTIEAMPENTVIENKFGSYSIEIEKINDSQLKYKRSLLILKGTHSKENYSKFRKFKRKIAKLDNAKIILIKNK